MKRFVQILAILITVPIVLLGAVFAYAQTRLAKDQISGLVESNLNGPNQQAELSELTGVLPFDVRIGRFRLSDDDGTWLEVDKARVKTSPTDILAGRIVVEDAGIERVALNRLPAGQPAADDPEPEQSGGFALPQLPLLPESIPVIRLDRLHVDRIEIGDAVIGEALVFNLEGKAATDDQGQSVDADLALTRIDQPTARLTLDAGADFIEQTVRFDIQGSETGGLMALLSQQERAGDLALSITGQGPLDDFAASINVDAANLASAGIDLGVGIGEIPKLILKGDVETAEGFLPQEVTDFVGRRVTVDIDAQQTAPGLFTVANLGLEAGELSMSGGGEADIEANTVAIAADLSVKDLSKASGLAGLPLEGTAALDIDLSGALDQPDARLSLGANAIAADQFGLSDATLLVQAKPKGSLKDGYQGVDAQASADLGGITQSGQSILGDERITLDAAVSAPVEGDIDLSQFLLNAGPLSANAGALLDAQTFEGGANVNLSVSSFEQLLVLLGPLAPPGLALNGAADLKLDADIDPNIEAARATLNLTTADLAGLPANAVDITGPSPDLSAKLDYRKGGPVQIQDLALNALALNLTGNVGLDQANQSLSGGSTSMYRIWRHLTLLPVNRFRARSISPSIWPVPPQSRPWIWRWMRLTLKRLASRSNLSACEQTPAVRRKALLETCRLRRCGIRTSCRWPVLSIAMVTSLASMVLRSAARGLGWMAMSLSIRSISWPMDDCRVALMTHRVSSPGSAS